MIQLLSKIYENFIPVKEDFNNKKHLIKNAIIPLILAHITAMIILLFLGKFLWNNYLTKMVTIVNPVESVFDLLALSILLNLLFGK